MSENAENSHSQLDLLDRIVDEILARNRKGERPSMKDYIERYPNFEEELRDIFPALAIMEEAKPEVDDLLPETQPLSTELSAHQRIGDYRILQELGRGGMGVVYEAEQESLGRRVALKVLPLQLADDERSKQRFQREAQAAAQLHHANIVPVFEVGSDHRHFFFAMQLIRGQGLDRVIDDLRRLGKSGSTSSPVTQRITQSFMTQRIQRRSDKSTSQQRHSTEPFGSGRVRPPEDATQPASLTGKRDISSSRGERLTFYKCIAEVGEQAANALAYAHGHGIIHRDVKPSNLMLDTTGTVWVVDFGLAKLDESEMTRTGDMLGTLRYMSPERLQGKCDARSDIYALGLTLYELVSLRPAFQAPDHVSLIDQINNVDVSSLRVLDALIPRDFETIILKCVEKDPRHRYVSAQALADDLRRFVGDEPIRARRLSRRERVARWVHRNPALTTALTSIFAILSCFAVVATYYAHHYSELAQQNSGLAFQREQERNAANKARELVSQQKAIAEEQRDLAHSFRYGLQLERTFERAAVASGDEAVGHVIHDWRTTSQRADPRGWEWHYLNSNQANPDVILPGHVSGLRDISFSPSGNQVLTAAVNDAVRLWSWPSGQLEGVLDFGQLIMKAEWSPSEEYLAIGHHIDSRNGPQVAVVVSNLAQNESYRFHASNAVRDLKWFSDSELFIHLADDTSAIISVPNMEVIQRYTVAIDSADLRYWDLAWSVDNQFCAYASEKEIVVYNRSGLVAARKHVRSIVELSWGQTADKLWTCNKQGKIEIWDVFNEFQLLKTVETDLSQLQTPSLGPAFNAACDKIALPAPGGVVCVVDVERGSRLLEFDSADTQFSHLEWDPDGCWLAKYGRGANARAFLWNIEQMLQNETGLPSNRRWETVDSARRFLTKRIVWSRDGSLIATCGSHAISIWDAASLIKVRSIPFDDWRGEDPPLHDMQISPDNKNLLTTSFTVNLIDMESGQRKWRSDVYGTALTNRNRHQGERMFVEVTVVTSAVWSPSGDRIAVSGLNKELRLLDPTTGKVVSDAPFENGNIDHIVAHGSFIDWTETGLHWATAGYGIGQWRRKQRPETIQGIATHVHTRCHTSVSPDGSMLAFPGREGIVQLVDLNAPFKPKQFVGHSARINKLSWSFDGNRLATCDDDGILRIWDPESGVCVGVMSDIAGHVFDPIGPRLALTDAVGNLKVVDANASYEKECPPEFLPVIERSLEAGSDRRYWLEKKALALCRQWDWDAAASIYSDLSRDGSGRQVFSPGWWAIHEMHADRTSWGSLAQLPEQSLQDAFRWYAPTDPTNGHVTAHRNVPYLLSPVYAEANQSLEIAIDSGDAKAAWLNGKRILGPEHTDSFQRRKEGLYEGWNMVVVEFDSSKNLPPRAGCAIRISQPGHAILD